MQPLIYRQLKPQLGFVLPLVQRTCTIYHHDLTAHCDRARSSATTSLPFGMALCRSAFEEPSRSEAAVPWEPPRLPPGWSPASLLTPPPAQAQQKAQGRVLQHCPSQGKGPNPPKQLFCKDRRSSKSPELAAGWRQPASSKQRQPVLPPGKDTYFLQPGRRRGPGPGGSSGWAFSAVRSAGSVASALSRGLTVNLLG